MSSIETDCWREPPRSGRPCGGHRNRDGRAAVRLRAARTNSGRQPENAAAAGTFLRARRQADCASEAIFPRQKKRHAAAKAIITAQPPLVLSPFEPQRDDVAAPSCAAKLNRSIHRIEFIS